MTDPLELWDRFTATVATMRSVVESSPHDELHRAEGVRYLLRFLSAGIAVCVEHDDADHPEIGTFIENRRSWGLDNPDTKYGFCRLAPDATYLLRGSAGTSRHLELQVNTGHMGDGNFAGWRALSRLSSDDLVVDPDGTVEIVISAHRPSDARNWMATGADANYLHVREYFSDWAVERPAVLAIERVGAPLPAPPLSERALTDRMELLEGWLTVGLACWDELGRGLATAEPGPIAPFLPPLSATGLGGLAYGMGAYRCGPDEAVVVEFRPPVCRYWSLSLANWFWESADIANRQCSVNDVQGVIDADGMVRSVISHRDPGVANWLDPAGYERGTLAVRYLLPDGLPTLDYRTVAFDRLDVELPDTARVTPAERRATIEARRHALVWRYRR